MDFFAASFPFIFFLSIFEIFIEFSEGNSTQNLDDEWVHVDENLIESFERFRGPVPDLKNREFQEKLSKFILTPFEVRKFGEMIGEWIQSEGKNTSFLLGNGPANKLAELLIGHFYGAKMSQKQRTKRNSELRRFSENLMQRTKEEAEKRNYFEGKEKLEFEEILGKFTNSSEAENEWEIIGEAELIGLDWFGWKDLKQTIDDLLNQINEFCSEIILVNGLEGQSEFYKKLLAKIESADFQQKIAKLTAKFPKVILSSKFQVFGRKNSKMEAIELAEMLKKLLPKIGEIEAKREKLELDLENFGKIKEKWIKKANEEMRKMAMGNEEGKKYWAREIEKSREWMGELEGIGARKEGEMRELMRPIWEVGGKLWDLRAMLREMDRECGKKLAQF